MNAPRRTISLGFTNEEVQEGLHVCYVYNDETERRRVMAKYVESGLLAGEKLLYLVDVMTPAELVSCLQELGVDVRSKGRDVALSQAAPAYCPSGSFDADEMLAVVRDFYRQALAEGYTGARGTGEMSWCLVEGRARIEQVLDYEARLNLLLQEHPYTTCCQYDARRFDGQTIMDVLSVHPVMIMQGQLVHNPYYMEPAAFLQDYRRRHASEL